LTEPRLKIAVFIDFDNIEIGVKTTLNSVFDVGLVLDALKERGEVVAKTAYGDWKRAGDHSRMLTQHAIRMVQRNLTPGGDKNGADINLALDALEMCFTHDHINSFVIVGGDSDFITLVEKLKQYDKKVFIVGGRAFTSNILQRNCYEFVAYENLVAAAAPRRTEQRGRPPQAAQAPISQAFPLVGRALQVLADREVSPQIGLLKSTLLQLDSTFSERTYGASTFRDFVEKLSAAGLVVLKQTGRNLLVELRDDRPLVEAPAMPAGAGAPAPDGPAAARPAAEPPPHSGEAADAAEVPPAGNGQPSAGAPDPERLAEGVREVRRLFHAASTSPRWPMYIRNVKQFLRGVDQSFDERRYGFAGLIDLLRASQREGLFRLERDRKGILRVFPGAQLPRASQPAVVVEPDVLDDARAAVLEEARIELAPAPAEIEETTIDVSPEATPVIELAEEPVVQSAAAPIESEPAADVRPARRRRTAATGGVKKTTTRRSARTAKPRTRKTAGPQ
jgi:uncharacterized LabA/DUF88 family protein